mgnify:CR=1 FL=1
MIANIDRKYGLQKVIDTVVFIDMDWTVASHEQGEDRTHRIGQKGQVQIYYMMCADTIDESMRDLLKEKQLFEIWKDAKLMKFREKLGVGDRSLNPCSNCTANGLLFGHNHVKKW